MSTRSLAVLAVMVALAWAAWWALMSPASGAGGGWSSWGLHAPAAGGSGARRPLLAEGEVPLEQVNRLVLERPGAPRLVFERSGQGWRQVEPYAHPGDPTLLREVLDVAVSLPQTRAVRPDELEPAARASLGLDEPQAVLTLAWPGGERVLALGRRTVAGRAWVQVRGRDEASCVDAALHTLVVEGDPRQWRSMGLFDAGAAEVNRIEMQLGQGADAAWVLEREGSRWKFVAPVTTRADAEAVRAYIEAVARAQADACAADEPKDLAAFGLAAPPFKLVLGRQGAAPALVEVGERVVQGADERYARVDQRPMVLQVGPRALAALFPPPAMLVDPRGSDANPAEVRRIVFRPALGSAEPAFELERARDAWVLREGAGAGGVGAGGVGGGGGAAGDVRESVASGEAVRRLLAQLTEARASHIAFNPLPADLLRGTFELVGESGQALGEVSVAREPQGRWALDGGDRVLRVFPEGFDVRTDARSYATPGSR